MSTTQVYVRIAVFRGDPIDYQKFRHTALWFQLSDGTEPFMIHVVGIPQELHFEVRDPYNPPASAKFAKEVQVGWLSVPMTRSQVLGLVYGSPPDNSNREYNCHSWVEAVLREWASKRYIAQNEYESAFNAMIDATLEANDEET